MAPLLREIRDNRLLWLLVFVCRSGDDSLSVAARGVEEQAISPEKSERLRSRHQVDWAVAFARPALGAKHTARAIGQRGV
jgi:hypothetical protein